jgi:PAS domain S-box-containing protein
MPKQKKAIKDHIENSTIDEAIYQAIFENSSTAIAILEENSTISLVNDAFCKLSGFSRDEVIGTNWTQRIPVEELEMLMRYNYDRINGIKGVPDKYEFKFYTKEGRLRYGLISASIIKQTKKTICTFTDITARKNAEEARRISEEHYRSLVEYANDIVYSITIEGIFTYASPNWTEILGHELHEILGHSVAEFVHPDDLQRLGKLIKRNFETGEKLSGIEYKLRNKNGDWRWYSSSSSPIRDADNKVTTLIGIAHDITERKKAEEELHKSQALLNTLVQTIPDLIWLKDINGVYLSCNIMFERFFGAPTEEIIGKTDYDFVDKESADFFRKNDQIAIEKNGPSSNEEWVTFADDGHRALLDTIKTPMFDSTGKLIGILGIARDITERKRHEEEIRDSQSKLSIALKIAHLGSWEYDVENDLFTFNDLFYAIFRTTVKEVGGYTMSSAEYAKRFVHPDEIAYVQEKINKSIETNDLDFSRQLEHRIIYSDGEVGYLAVRFSFIKDSSGKTIKTYGINQDITESKRAEQILKESETQLRELNATKDKFFSIIAHDLRNPFSLVLGLSEIIADENFKLSNEELRQNSLLLYKTASATFTLLENLLEWSKLQRGLSTLMTDSIPLLKFAENLNKTTQEMAFKKSIILCVEIPESLEVIADPNMLHSILRNLITNAIKFTKKGGKVTVSATEKENGFVQFMVKDSGIGMTPDMIKNLFHIEFNTCRPGTEDEPSTGLGLILCKEFVEKHGGKIWVESEVGKGSTFYFSIPGTSDSNPLLTSTDFSSESIINNF